MKFILFILLFSINVYGQTNININGAGTPVNINGTGTGLTINYTAWQTESTIIDDGYYNGFPMLADAEDRTVYGVYRKSDSHVNGGALMLVKTTDGGETWTEDSIYVDGVAISSTNHSFQRLSIGRMLISYRVAGVMYFAYNDNNDRNFTSSVTTVSPATDYALAQSPVKMLEMPSGNILFAYYNVGSNGNPATQELMRSVDSGVTFSAYSQIHTGDSLAATGSSTLGNWRGNEVAIAITHPTGTDETTKMVALIRTEVANDGGTYPMFYYSSNGGLTWEKDLVNTDAGSFENDLGATISSGAFSRHLLYSFLNTNSPVDIRLHGDSVYVINGERSTTYGPALKVISAIPDSAYQNKFSNWTRPRLVKMFTVGGAVLDHGYPVFFTANGDLYAAYYDMSSQATIPERSSKRVLSKIIKISL